MLSIHAKLAIQCIIFSWVTILAALITPGSAQDVFSAPLCLVNQLLVTLVLVGIALGKLWIVRSTRTLLFGTMLGAIAVLLLRFR